MKLDIKDTGLYIDMTHDATEYKNRTLALNGILSDTYNSSDDFVRTIDSWNDAMLDAMQTLDSLTDEEIAELERQMFDDKEASE